MTQGGAYHTDVPAWPPVLQKNTVCFSLWQRVAAPIPVYFFFSLFLFWHAFYNPWVSTVALSGIMGYKAYLTLTTLINADILQT